MNRIFITDLVEREASKYKHPVYLAASNAEIRKQLKLQGWNDTRIDNLIRSQLLIGSLLGDLVIQPTSHYYVPETRKIMLENRDIFDEGLGVFVLGEGVEDFEHDVEQKRVEYPSEENIFRDERHMRRSVEELASFGPKIYRAGGVGNSTGLKWQEQFDGESSDGARIINEIGRSSEISDKDKSKLIETLPILPCIREGQAFDWSFIHRKLAELGIKIPEGLISSLRGLLLRCYIQSCSDLYCGRIVCGSSAETFIYPRNKGIDVLDINLFIDFAHLLGIGEIIPNLTSSNIVDIKKHFKSFDEFRNRYFSIIRQAIQAQDRQLGHLCKEIQSEEGIELSQLKSFLLEASTPLLLECAREVGLLKQPSYFVYPRMTEVYTLKKILVNYESIPFIRFRDELIHSYETKFRTIVTNAICNQSNTTNIYYSCSFISSQFGSQSVLTGDFRENAYDTIERNDAVSKFVFGSNNKFDNCHFGDNTHVNNYVNAITSFPTINNNLKMLLIDFRTSLDQAADLSDSQKAMIVSVLNSLSHELSIQAKDRDTNRLKKLWKEIRDGVQTCSHLTSIVLGLGKLLGFP